MPAYAEDLIGSPAGFILPIVTACAVPPRAHLGPRNAGPGLIHRTVVAVWRNYFHPPADDPKFTT